MSEEGFFSRWSRRKRAAEAGLTEAEAPPATPAPPVAAPDQPPVAAAPPGRVVAADPPEPEFDLASLPSIDSLTAASDFTAFLQKGVPEALRRAALRKAWSLDPVISTYIGPADYAWDFNAPDGVPGFALELGGDVRKLLAQAIGLDRDDEEEEEEAREAEAPAESAEPDAAPSMLAQQDDVAPAAADDAPLDIAAIDAPTPIEEAPPAPPALPRRHGSALPS